MHGEQQSWHDWDPSKYETKRQPKGQTVDRLQNWSVREEQNKKKYFNSRRRRRRRGGGGEVFILRTIKNRGRKGKKKKERETNFSLFLWTLICEPKWWLSTPLCPPGARQSPGSRLGLWIIIWFNQVYMEDNQSLAGGCYQALGQAKVAMSSEQNWHQAAFLQSASLWQPQQKSQEPEEQQSSRTISNRAVEH